MENLGHFPQGKTAATESHYPTLINYKVHAGSFHLAIIHWTLTWTTGSLINMPMWSFFMRPCTHRGLAHRQRVSTFLTNKKTHNFFLCSWRRRGSNPGSVNLESDALPTEPPRLDWRKPQRMFHVNQLRVIDPDWGLLLCPLLHVWCHRARNSLKLFTGSRDQYVMKFTAPPWFLLVLRKRDKMLVFYMWNSRAGNTQS